MLELAVVTLAARFPPSLGLQPLDHVRTFHIVYCYTKLIRPPGKLNEHSHPYFLDSLCNALFNGESANSPAKSISRCRPVVLNEAGLDVCTTGGKVTCTLT